MAAYGRVTREIPLNDTRAKSESRSHPPAIANAVAYMSDHLGERIHLRDLSSAAGVSARTLGYLFLRTYDATPMAYLKRRRLERARNLLLQADPSNESVAEIARQCGFTHMGQFSLDYKRAMGELPSETLHRRHNGRGTRSRRLR